MAATGERRRAELNAAGCALAMGFKYLQTAVSVTVAGSSEFTMLFGFILRIIGLFSVCHSHRGLLFSRLMFYLNFQRYQCVRHKLQRGK